MTKGVSGTRASRHTRHGFVAQRVLLVPDGWHRVDGTTMRAIFYIGMVALEMVSAGAATDMVSPAATAEPPRKLVYVIPVRADIDAPLVYVVRRGVKEAERANADTIVLDMDTNGGRGDAMGEIMDTLARFKGDTYTFVNDKAYSAGAFIATATKHIYMAPGSVIGAATPMMVMPTGDSANLPEAYQKSSRRPMPRRYGPPRSKTATTPMWSIRWWTAVRVWWWTGRSSNQPAAF